MTRDVLLRVLALADDRRREDGVGRGDGRGEDERREELEARDDGVHERAGRHPAEEHAAERTDRVVSGRQYRFAGKREARTLAREASPSLANAARRRLCEWNTSVSVAARRARNQAPERTWAIRRQPQRRTTQ